MNIDNMTIGQARELARMFGAPTAAPPSTIVQGDQRQVIVRSRDQGVIFGELVSYDPASATVTVGNARQMWRWFAKSGGTLLDCAEHGVDNSRSKFSAPVSSLIVFGACGIIDVSAAAAESLRGATWA